MKLFPPTRFVKLLFIAVAFIATSCKKEKPVDNTPTGIQAGQGVFIANEGLFGGGNASLMYYKFGDNAASADMFEAKNNYPIGDVLQSMTRVGGELFLMVNNSNRIETVQLPTVLSTWTIAGLSNPRNMTAVGNDIFVTGYGSNNVTRISLTSKLFTGVITLPSWSDAILNHNGELFITAPATNNLFICDPNTLAIVDSVDVGKGANSLMIDQDGNLWVFAAGESWNGIGGALKKIDPSTRQVLNNFDLGMTIGSAGRLTMNGALDSLYYLNGDVFRMSINDSALPSTSFIAAASRYFYSLYRHPTKPLIFVGDAIDFLQNGEMYIYDANATLQHVIPVGVGPTQIMAY